MGAIPCLGMGVILNLNVRMQIEKSAFCALETSSWYAWSRRENIAMHEI